MSRPKAKTKVVLASKSPARLTTLKNAGITPLVRISDVDEDAVIDALRSDASPAQIVCALAEAKALQVAHTLADEQQGLPDPSQERYLVVGSDSMLEIGGRMVGKPLTPQVAVERIREMRGRDATLWTGHCLIQVSRCPSSQKGVGAQKANSTKWCCSRPQTEPAATTVHFGQISDTEIDAYVGTGEPLQVAGSFTIDGLGGPFIDGVTGDPHAVVGLSLPVMRRLVNRFGIEWPELWTDK